MLAVESEGVTLEENITVVALDLEFVVGAFTDAGNEDFPDSAADEFAHDVHAAIPVVEVSNDANALCIRCPHAEGRASHTVNRRQMRSEFVVEIPVVAFRVEVDIRVAEDASVGIWVMHFPRCAVMAFELQRVGELLHAFGQHRFKKSRLVDFRSLEHARAIQSINHLDRCHVGTEDPDGQEVARTAHAKRVERICMARFQKSGKFFGGDG